MKLFISFSLCFIFTFSFHEAQCQSGNWRIRADKNNAYQKHKESTVDQLKNQLKYAKEWGLHSSYKNRLMVNARLNTNGWTGGIFYNKATKKKTNVWSLNFSEIYHQKEIKIKNTGEYFNNLGKTSTFKLGKINNVYTLQFMYGKEHLIFPGILNGNTSMSFYYGLGPVIAIEKPYYLHLIYYDTFPSNTTHLQTEKYSQDNQETFLKPSAILGHAPWSKGILESNIIPGLFAEIALIIEPDYSDVFLKRMMIGGNAAFYSHPLTIMAENNSYPYHFSFFIGISLGKRW